MENSGIIWLVRLNLFVTANYLSCTIEATGCDSVLYRHLQGITASSFYTSRLWQEEIDMSKQ